MAKTSASINLLKTNKNEGLSQIVNWALTIGRVLIITVELIALSAFLYRFVLDNELQKLQTKIKEEQAIVSSQKTNEDAYRNLQDRLAVISSFSKSGSQNTKIFKDIISFAPIGMTFTNVTLSQETVHIEANVNSVIPLSVFIGKLKAYPSIDTISIDKIENKTANAVITVGITTTLKGDKNANSKN